MFIGIFRLFYALLIERYEVFVGKVRHMNERKKNSPLCKTVESQKMVYPMCEEIKPRIRIS